MHEHKSAISKKKLTFKKCMKVIDASHAKSVEVEILFYSRNIVYSNAVFGSYHTIIFISYIKRITIISLLCYPQATT